MSEEVGYDASLTEEQNYVRFLKHVKSRISANPTPDKLALAVEALEPFAALADKFAGPVVEVCDPHPDNPSRNIQPLFSAHLERAFQALAAIKAST